MRSRESFEKATMRFIPCQERWTFPRLRRGTIKNCHGWGLQPARRRWWLELWSLRWNGWSGRLRRWTSEGKKGERTKSNDGVGQSQRFLDASRSPCTGLVNSAKGWNVSRDNFPCQENGAFRHRKTNRDHQADGTANKEHVHSSSNWLDAQVIWKQRARQIWF